MSGASLPSIRKALPHAQALAQASAQAPVNYAEMSFWRFCVVVGSRLVLGFAIMFAVVLAILMALPDPWFHWLISPQATKTVCAVGRCVVVVVTR